MKRKAQILTILLAGTFSCLTACTFNPFVPDNDTTGSPVATVLGVGAGAGTAALLNAPKPVIGLAGVAGGALGYYFTSMRFDAGGVIRGGGQVYQIGDIIGIYIPTDDIFEPNTDDFLPQAGPILDSAANVLNRAPNNNVIISGNTSGFASPRWEQRLAEKRAAKVGSYLWNAGVISFKNQSNDVRQLNYVGYGDYFPISNNFTNRNIRRNSRIQIVSYPTGCDLNLDKRHVALHNVGGDEDKAIAETPNYHCRWNADGSARDCWED